MESQVITLESLIDEMDNGVTVIAGNTQLARWLTNQFGARKTAVGEKTWATPDVTAWSAWLASTWDSAVADGIAPAREALLSEAQELRVWRDIVAENSYGLLRTTATAQRAKAAWKLFVEWRLDKKLLAENSTEDYEAFVEWLGAFEHRCAENAWLPVARVTDKLVALIEQGRLKPARDLRLVGFDELSPAQQRLLVAIGQAGRSAQWVALSGRAGRASRIRLPDSRAEMATISHWVRQRLIDNPSALIGIVVPDVAAHAAALEHRLARTLAPESLFPGKPVPIKPWALSRGRVLRSYSLIQTALAILRMLEGAASMSDMTTLLLSPFIAGWEEEMPHRALLDARIRDDGELRIRFNRLLWLCKQRDQETGQPRPWASPLLAKRLSALRKIRAELDASASPTAWSAYFAKCLSAVGWSRGRTLDATELQLLEAWRALLNDFGSLDTVCRAMSYAEALDQLSDLASRRTLALKAPKNPISIVGLNESNGLAFDHLWVMGLHDGVWPPAPRPDPYLPLEVQKLQGLPRANVEREFDAATRVTQRLARAADEVVFSHPASEGDEELRPSPLLAAFGELDEGSLGIEHAVNWRDRVRASGRLEQLTDGAAPGLDTVAPSGGSGILKSQSLCPFRAFAKHRLGAEGFRESVMGLDPMKKGSLVHKSLELFWQDTRDHQQLLALSDEQLKHAVDRAVEAALVDAQNASEMLKSSSRFRELEKARLVQMLLGWLDEEKARAPFTNVGLEHEVDDLTIEGVPFRLVIDRIDELADGRRVIIDYKTGSISPSDWFGERPNDPQLPLYSTATAGSIGGVVFGQLRANKLQFRGVVAEDGIIPNLPPHRKSPEKAATETWPQVLDDWRATIRALARDFAAGQATVTPKDGLKTCDKAYCDLHALCRVHELLAADDDREEGE